MAKEPKRVDQSKRNFLRGVATTGSIVTLSHLIGPTMSPTLAAIAAGQRKPSPTGDVAIINEAIKLEQKAINTYRAALQADLLKRDEFVEVAVQFADDHGRHRDELTRALRVNFKTTGPLIEKLGTFDIPQKVLTGKEADVIRYALTLEMIASKTYLDAVSGALATDEARGLVASILPVETEHVAVFRSVLMIVLKDKALPEDKQLVPFAFFNEQPTPEIKA